MLFEERKSMLYSDTLVPDVFISDYLPMMEGDYVKIYVYWMFLSKYNKKISIEDMAKTLGLDSKRLESALYWFVQNGLISKGEKGFQISDLKEREIHKHYSRGGIAGEIASGNSLPKLNAKRISVIRTINNKFFQGVMSISWYHCIDEWFDLFKFDEDVMYSLFHHCFQRNVLNNRSYIQKVAENWHRKDIKNIFQLDEYMKEYEKMKKVCSRIANRLKLGRPLTVYEEEIVEKWITEYKFSFDIIEIALKLTTNQTNPNFKYLDAIITSWSDNGLSKKEEIITFVEQFHKTKRTVQVRSNTTPASAVDGQNVPQKTNYKQREYEDDFFDGLYYTGKETSAQSSKKSEPAI